MRVVSLFSGAGGLDLGLIQAGHQVVWANDYDADSVATYRRNIGDHAALGDISAMPSNEIPSADVVVGGFPCQGFSLANMRRSVDDERNLLYEEFRRVVGDKRPRYFLAENVRGILSLGGGMVIQRIRQELEGLGYRVRYQLFNLADYGVPQLRQRVIIAGTRADLPAGEDFVFPAPTHGKNAGLVLSPWVTVAEALGRFPDPDGAPNPPPNHVYSRYKVNGRNFTGHRFTDGSKPSPTILARGNGKGGVCAIPHPNGVRRMTIRESAAVQTFPDDFEFVGAMNSCYRQVGNAVPVLFARHLGASLSLCEAVGAR